MEIEKSELIKRFSLLERAIPGKPTIPCTEGILVKDGRMCTNDLQNAISILAPEAALESFILPKKAIAMVKNLPDGMVQITPKGDGALIIKAGNIRTSIKTMSIDGFPENFTLSEATEATIDFDDLVEMLSSVVYATATSEARPIHTGVLLDSDGTDLNVVACDGFRCAWAHTEYPEAFKMVIPKPTVKLLLSIKQEGKLKISMQGEVVYNCQGYISKTNADSIRRRNDEQLSEFLNSHMVCECCVYEETCTDYSKPDQCRAGVLAWLQKPVQAKAGLVENAGGNQ